MAGGSPEVAGLVIELKGWLPNAEFNPRPRAIPQYFPNHSTFRGGFMRIAPMPIHSVSFALRPAAYAVPGGYSDQVTTRRCQD